MFRHRGLPIAIEYQIVAFVVDRAPDSKHGVAGVLDPPSAGAFHPCVADEFVGRLNTATADRISSQTAGTLV